MSGDKRIVVDRHHVSLLTGSCLAVLMLLPGCSDLRVALGMDRVGPDEFAIEARAPLTIPPDFNLRPPQPGAPRPQELTAAERARRVIDAAGPGEPGRQASPFTMPDERAMRGPEIDPDRQVTENSLASKLLGSGDSAPGGTVGRDTKPLRGVY